MQVLVAGSEVTLEYRIQVYTPPYFLNGKPQPVIGKYPVNMSWNLQYEVTWSGTSSIDRIVLHKMADSTHSIAWDLRQVRCPTLKQSCCCCPEGIADLPVWKQES